MHHKIEVIDYLRGLSLIAIIIIHVIGLNDTSLISEYSKLPILFALRDILQVAVITIIICSGFSIYLTQRNLQLSCGSVIPFYKKRFKRLLLPYWYFLIIFFAIQYLIKWIFGKELVTLSKSYILSSFLMMGGIGIGWLVLLMLIIMLFFPFINYFYNRFNKLNVFIITIILYLLSYLLSITYHFDIFNLKFEIISLIFFSATFIFGWSLVYMLGFYLEELYNNHLSLKKELRITLFLIALFASINLLYKYLGMDIFLYKNKYPPTPYYLSMGLMFTFIFLTIFFLYKRIIHKHIRKTLEFFSNNSFWAFLWNALTVTLISPILFFQNIYLRFIIELLLNFLFVIFLVTIQKRFIKMKIFSDKHHFH